MKKQLLQIPIQFSILILACAYLPYAGALSTDKNQDIEIESNSVYLDDTKNHGIYTGNVIVLQGSIRITGDKLTVYYTDENELNKIIISGQPATFRQLPDNSSVYDEAEALIMEYHENDSMIILSNQAKVMQGDRRLLAEHIEYDTELSQVRAKGSQADDSAQQDDRVRLIIPGKKEEAQTVE